MSTRLHLVAPVVLAGLLVAWTDLPAARAGEKLATETSTRKSTRPLALKVSLPIGRLVAHQSETPQAGQQSAKPAARQGITVERLWDRWQARRGSPQPEAAPQPTHEQPGSSEEQLEAPRSAQDDGNFPVFRAGPPPQAPLAAAPSTAAVPPNMTMPNVSQSPSPATTPAQTPAPTPAAAPQQAAAARAPVPVPGPIAAPVIANTPTAAGAAPTSVMTRYEEPVPVGKQAVSAISLNVSPSVPSSTPGIALRSTSSYLAEQVRFGIVLRGASGGTSLDPTQNILGEVRTTQPEASDPAASHVLLPGDDAGPRPQMASLAGEDTTRFRTIAPEATAEFSGRPATLSSGAAQVAPTASSAALQQALRRYGKPHDGSHPIAQIEAIVPTEAELQPIPEPELQPDPQPQLQPVPEAQPGQREDTESQRSVLLGGSKPLGFDRAGQPQGSGGIRLKGLSRAMDKSAHGSVTGIDRHKGTILIGFPNGHLPAIGQNIQVCQKFLFHRHPVGDFQVIAIQGNVAIARPTEPLDLEMIVNGDEAVVMN
jgi:hypothetical protein